jgi:hypothetical protein
MNTSIYNHAVKVYEGKVTYLYHSLGISQTYYGSIFKGLQQVGSITKVNRGGRGTAPTAYVLHRKPALDEWKKLATKPLTRPRDFAILSQQVQDLAQQIGGINIGEALVHLEQRLERVEEKVGINNGKS